MTPTPERVVPLTRKTRRGGVLRRPAGVEAEIAAALELAADEIVARAEADPAAGEAMSEECIVHMIRNDLRIGKTSPHRSTGGTQLAEALTPILLARCEATLKGSIRGFPPASADDIREEVLGRLVVSLAGPGDEADFLEVRFALAVKRLRIDACRRERRRLQGLVTLDETPAAADAPEAAAVEPQPPAPPSQENRLLIRQALGALTPEERKVVVLHKIAGVPLNSAAAGSSLVGLLGRSERTLRNRLRSAEAKLVDFRRRRPARHPQEASR